MNALLGKAGKKLFEKHMEQYTPADPLYESYMNEKGQSKRRQRPLPPGLSKRDARILKSVRRRAHYLDKGFNICGFRFGWNFFIGMVPIAGDITNMTLNHYLIVYKTKEADIPKWLVHRMEVNNILSTGMGFVPVVGDVAVAVYKTNSRNAALFEEFMRIRGEEFLKQNPPHNGHSAGNSGSGRRRWTWFTGQRLSANDAEQVKPGAGLTAGETVPTAPVDVDANPGPMVGTSGVPPGGFPDKDASTSSRKLQKGFSLFGNNKNTTSQSHSSGLTDGKQV
ncbi:hypothetical protein D9756_003037 [Leucocoprinus leucothites]|uniref:Uncharacterized protein n=1 Tax=Leucocoprinus leucothites TaxID=201217 RepID=A0A8H5G7D5_9AGAR|nr:hypothetical protein D9756_003037 [Leucoagaricus leucothites]